MAGSAATVTLPRPSPSMTSPRAPSWTAQSINRPSLPAEILTSVDALLQPVGRDPFAFADGRRATMTRSLSTMPSGPKSRLRKVSVASVCVLVASRGGDNLIVHDDEHAEAARRRVGRDAHRRAQVAGPSQLSSELLRIAPTKTTGLSVVEHEVEQVGGLLERVRAVSARRRPRSLASTQSRRTRPASSSIIGGVMCGPGRRAKSIDRRNRRRVQARHARENLLARERRHCAARSRVDLHRDRPAGEENRDSWVHTVIQRIIAGHDYRTARLKGEVEVLDGSAGDRLRPRVYFPPAPLV